MKILEVKPLQISDVKVIRYQRFKDDRGYFTETYRVSDFDTNPQTPFLKNVRFTQTNESFSKKKTVRGLHFQWNPYMAKLVRIVEGSMIDVGLDIRKGSPTFGKIVGYEMRADNQQEYAQWIWIPVGFAHGVFFLEDGLMEYFCTGQWAPETERGISPLSLDIDWSLCDIEIKHKIDDILSSTDFLSEKDRNGMSVSEWAESPDTENFIYSS